jgi:hypothetical protein
MAAEAHTPRICWRVPRDGGTPRDPGRIVRLGDREFLVRASVEEGRSPLTHAVSRVDLVWRNEGGTTEEITVHLDLGGDGQRTNFDSSPFGGMPRRDFVYVQPVDPPGPPDQPWRRVDGTTDGWVVSVSLALPPGETRLGLSPWYTYGDYLAFVRGLPEHPCLARRLVGHSDGGSEQWELTFTDPAVPAAHKQRVFWHAREHAYETFSSFAIEGLVEYLLSAEAAGVRRRFAITLHPMTNVDGVADGAEYRGGYDYPDPRGTATARLTWDTIERLRPDLIVAWHNWHAPRDVDSLFYTYAGSDGRASRRAWDLFTQRFPSPRRLGHRWQSETNPLERNWAALPTSDAAARANAHRYALRAFDTRVWGWEMPWWGRDDTDGGDPAQHARRAGADFARAFFATLRALELPAAPAPAAPTIRAACDHPSETIEDEPLAVPEVPRWAVHEFVLSGRAHVANPFRDASLVGEFVSPSGRSLVTEGFYDPDGSDGGPDRWRLRVALDEDGEWRYRLRGEGVEVYQEGRLRCVAPGSGDGGLREPVRVDPHNPYAFAHAGGAPFFGMGDTCYGLVNGIGDAQRRDYLDTRAAQRFNFVRFFASGYPWEAHATLDERDTWPWGGTPGAPDYDRLNPRFFRRLDRIVAGLASRGMRAEILVFNLYLLAKNHGGHNPWGTAARERFWVRSLAARLAASPAVFLWTVANEFECYPDGRYRYDPSDAAWARRMGALLNECDPYRHPTTVHPMGVPGGGLVRAQGPLFGDGPEIDVLTHQHNAYDTATWVAGPDPGAQPGTQPVAHGYWEGSGAGVDAALRLDRVYRKPVINTEFGYEWLAGYPADFNRQVHSTGKCRRTAWRIVAGGGAALAAGFAGTWHGRDASFRGVPAPFVVADQGAARQLGYLYDFVAALPLGRLEPFDGIHPEANSSSGGGDADDAGEALARADPGKTYVVYLPRGGRAALDLSAAGARCAARWFNPRTGEYGSPFAVPGGRTWHLSAPDRDDWILRVDAVGAFG